MGHGKEESLIQENIALSQENRTLRYELMRYVIFSISDKIKEEIDYVLEDKESMNAYNPIYHAWQIVHDINHDLTIKTSDADYEMREAILGVLTYLQDNSEEIVKLTAKDPRWKLFADRELDYEDLRKMRGLAHVVMNEGIDLLTKGVFGSLIDKVD